eukprot:TRINITY_DN2525_c0_g1_i1.p1 TRINITY_DN2525_c0_g1~~TRINITY_DN2525_c0_g1_i1.p1  ORF type:complete len:1672 (-),score=131.03 TRINITY_DN2525_c0_g1_i1:3202-8217(-)
MTIINIHRRGDVQSQFEKNNTNTINKENKRSIIKEIMLNEESYEGSESQDLEAILQKILEDDSYSQLKHTLFQFLQAFAPKIQFTPFSAVFLIAFSFLQLLSLLVVNSATSSSSPYEYLGYFQILPLVISPESTLLYYVWVYFVAFVVVLYIVCAVVAYSNPNGNMAYYCSSMTAPFFWMFLVPIAETLLSVWDCSGNQFIPANTCWKGIHTFNALLMIFIALLSVFLFAFITVASAFSHPYNRDPFVHFPWTFEIVYSILRVFLVTRSLPFWGEYFGPYFIQGTNLMICVYLLTLVWGIFPYYNPTTSLTFSGSVMTTIGATLFNFAHAIFYDEDSNHELLVLFVICVISVMMAKVLQQKWYYWLLVQHKDLSPQEACIKAYILTSGLITQEHSDMVPLSFLQGFMNKALGDDLSYSFMDVSSISLSSPNDQLRIRRFIVGILDMRDSSKTSEIYVQLARGYLHLLENAYSASKRMRDAENMHPGFLLQFDIYCLKTSVQEYLLKAKRDRAKKGYGDFYSVVQYELIYKAFCDLLKKAALIRLDFWNNLATRPDLNTLHTLGLNIMNVNQNVVKAWNRLSSIYPNHEEALALYCSYLNNIVGLTNEANELAERLERQLFLRREDNLNNSQLFSLNSISIIVSYSKDKKTKILRASSNTKQVFGYSQKSLVNKDLTMLMPRIIGGSHNTFMEDHLLKGKYSNTKSHETFGLHQNGYIFPIRVSSQQVFSMKFGLLYAGNVQKLVERNESSYILTDSNGRIEGISKELGELLCITPAMIAHDEKWIQQYCPELNNKDYPFLEGQHKLNFILVNKDQKPGFDVQAATKTLMEKRRGKRRSTFCTKNEEMTRIVTRCEIKRVDYPSAGLTLKIFKMPLIKPQKITDNGEEDRRDISILPEIKEENSYYKNRESNYSVGNVNNSKLDVSNNLLSIPGTNAAVEQVGLPSANPKDAIAAMCQNENSITHDAVNRNSTAIFEGTHYISQARLLRDQTRIKGQDMLDKSDTKSLGSLASSKVNKTIADLRRLQYEDFYPLSVQRLKWIILIFTLLLIVAFSARLVLAVVLNKKFSIFAGLMLSNSRRVSSMGEIGKNARELTLYYENPDTGRPWLNNAARTKNFDYSTLLPKGYNEDVVDYRTYLINGIKLESLSLMNEQLQVMRSLRGFTPENVELIEPSAITLTYYPSENKVECGKEALSTAIFKVVSHSWEFISAVEENRKDMQAEVSAHFLIQNVLQVLIRYSRYARDGIVAEYNRTKQTLNNWSLYLLIGVVSVLVIFMLVIFPFLLIVHNEQSSMLLMLTRIPKTDLKQQAHFINTFLRDLRNNISGVQESETPENGPLERDEEPLSPVSPEEDTENEKDDEKSPRKHRRGRHRRTQLVYTPLHNKSWKVFILFFLFCGFLLGMYIGYNATSIKLTDSLLYQSNELYVVTRGLYYCSYNIAYFYNYALTNRTATCGTLPCVTYMTTRMVGRFRELNKLLIDHKNNEGLMTEKYNKLFKDIFERNPCQLVEYFKNQKDCETIFGGLFKQGVYAASVNFIHLQKAIKSDFEAKPRTMTEIEAFMNDPRLIELEIINEKFLRPAYTMLGERIMEDAKEITATNNVVATWYFLAIAVALITVSWFGGKWVVEYLRKSIFNTKSMLANLPPLVLETNKFLGRFLMGHLQYGYQCTYK